mmetsp:Transcript_27423/g.52225  ORF Transcript_27423/g.52225 Transcript_27423/m.52225 type:complete len:96 (+) Transcript_27423:625-912(+)
MSSKLLSCTKPEPSVRRTRCREELVWSGETAGLLGFDFFADSPLPLLIFFFAVASPNLIPILGTSEPRPIPALLTVFMVGGVLSVVIPKDTASPS